MSGGRRIVRRLAEGLREADAVVHAAGSYRVGIARSERGAMWDANIGTTTRVLDAAEVAGVGRIVYLSTVAALGNTHGIVVDETHRRDLREGFVSWYDETKYGAHEVAQQRAIAGAPVVTALPSQVYGPADHSPVGDQLRMAFRGQLRYRVLDDVGLGFVHVDDLASGIIAALGQGVAGQSYVLSGPTSTLTDVLATAARLGGHGLPPRIPTGLLRVIAPFGPLVGRPSIPEAISSSAGVTYWASSAKAAAQLGFVARGIEDGLRDTFGLPAGD
ncbi:MAG: NAD-dependent epimerase/dehydratase family protein [Chloroflexi bacterium]|nr:NAD-dependent epimerase/dehydratase family protein [Chloroflexota bacterium]